MSDEKEELPAWLCDKPVLLYGARKAGTTLLQNLCDGGDELIVYPAEMKLKKLRKVLWSAEPESILEQYDAKCELEEAPSLHLENYGKLIASLKDQSIGSLGELIQHHIQILHQCVDGPEWTPKRWAVKEVGGDTDVLIRLWRHMYLSSKIVLILRDPLMTIRSIIRQRRSQKVKMSVSKIFREVRDVFQVVTAISRLMGEKSVHIVCYEEMTDDPEKVMRGVCNYLEVNFHEKMTQPTIFGNSVVVNTSSKSTDKVFKTEVSWKNDLTVREVLCVTLSKALLRVRNAFVRTRYMINFSPYPEIIGELRRRSGG